MNILFRDEGEIKTTRMKKNQEFATSSLAVKELLKEVLQTEGTWNQESWKGEGSGKRMDHTFPPEFLKLCLTVESKNEDPV